MISALVQRFPDCINRRRKTVTDPQAGHSSRAETLMCPNRLKHSRAGDTVLHYCARMGRADAIMRWLPLDNSQIVYIPVSRLAVDKEKVDVMKGKTRRFGFWTALHEAILHSHGDIAEHLLAKLTTTMNETTAPLVTDAIKLMAWSMPHLVFKALEQLDARCMLSEEIIETKIHTQTETFVAGRAQLLQPGKTQSAQSKDVNGNTIYTRWPDSETNHILPSTRESSKARESSRVAQVNLKVFQLADFIGPPTGQHSLFSNIVDNCDYTVCTSLCFKAAVDYKWNRMQNYVKLDLAVYLVSLFIASWATVCTAWNIANPWDLTGRFETAEVVVCIVIVVEAPLFVWEVTKVCLLGGDHGPTGCDWWNLIKLVAPALLMTASINYLLLVSPLDDQRVTDADWGDYDISIKIIGDFEMENYNTVRTSTPACY